MPKLNFPDFQNEQDFLRQRKQQLEDLAKELRRPISQRLTGIAQRAKGSVTSSFLEFQKGNRALSQNNFAAAYQRANPEPDFLDSLNPFSDFNKKELPLTLFLAANSIPVVAAAAQVVISAKTALKNTKNTLKPLRPQTNTNRNSFNFNRTMSRRFNGRNKGFNTGRSGNSRDLARMRRNERSTLSRITRLERQIRDRPLQEVKSQRTASDPAACTTAGGMAPASTIAEGPGDKQRIGRKIKMRSLDWQWTFERGITTAGIEAQQFRMIIFMDTMNVGLAPDITGKNGLLAENTVSSMYNEESFPRYKVIVDKLYVVSSKVDPITISDGGRVNMRGMFQWYQGPDADTVSLGKNSLWLFCKKFQGGVTPAVVLKTQFKLLYVG